jgi:CheY-like chemotaxis protein
VLAVIVGNARLGLEEIGFPSRLRRRLERIERAGDFAVELTNQILTTAGKRSLRLAVVDISRLVAGMVDLLRASISPKAELEVELREQLPPIYGDATQLRQLTMNLVRNAADALGGSEGRITIRTGVTHLDANAVEYSPGLADPKPGEHLFLEISDTGPGLDEGTRDRIFEPFFSTRQSGRGLGLAAVRGIVNAHRAIITLETEPGEGCTFRVLFPTTLEARIDVGEKSGSAASQNPSGTVLVVDDDPAVLELAEVYLERVGFEVIPSQSGEEALRLFEERAADIDVVVLDLAMPGLDGQETFIELQRRKRHIRVVVVSGYGREVAAERFGVIAEAQAFLSKPYEPEELVAAVHRALVHLS